MSSLPKVNQAFVGRLQQQQPHASMPATPHGSKADVFLQPAAAVAACRLRKDEEKIMQQWLVTLLSVACNLKHLTSRVKRVYRACLLRPHKQSPCPTPQRSEPLSVWYQP